MEMVRVERFVATISRVLKVNDSNKKEHYIKDRILSTNSMCSDFFLILNVLR